VYNILSRKQLTTNKYMNFNNPTESLKRDSGSSQEKGGGNQEIKEIKPINISDPDCIKNLEEIFGQKLPEDMVRHINSSLENINKGPYLLTYAPNGLGGSHFYIFSNGQIGVDGFRSQGEYKDSESETSPYKKAIEKGIIMIPRTNKLE